MYNFPGLTIFKGIRAFDRDKPNTPNSDVHYSITAGDELGRFTLESSHKPALILAKPLDFDNGDKEFLLVITASVRPSIINLYRIASTTSSRNLNKENSFDLPVLV